MVHFGKRAPQMCSWNWYGAGANHAISWGLFVCWTKLEFHLWTPQVPYGKWSHPHFSVVDVVVILLSCFVTLIHPLVNAYKLEHPPAAPTSQTDRNVNLWWRNFRISPRLLSTPQREWEVGGWGITKCGDRSSSSTVCLLGQSEFAVYVFREFTIKSWNDVTG